MTKKRFKLMGLALIAFIGAFFLIACGSKTSTGDSKQDTGNSVKEVKVKFGKEEVTVPSNPKKVVTFDLGAADTIRALGKEDSIAGMPTAVLPKYLADFSGKVESVGNMKEPDFEAIQKLKPDLIIASVRTADYLDKFKEIAPTIILETEKGKHWESVQSNIKALASIYGEEAEKEADKQLADLDSQIKDISSANKKSEDKTLTMMLNEGSMSIFGAESRFAFLYDTLGFKATDAKVEDARHGQEISFEGVSDINPDRIFVINRTLAIGGDNSANDSLMQNELIQATKAAQNSAIITLTSDIWYLSGGGLESTQLMINDVKDAVK